MGIFDTLVLMRVITDGEPNVRACTGFFISKYGHILTAAHTFNKKRVGNIKGILAQYGSLYKCKIINDDFKIKDYIYDLIVLQIETPLPANLHFAELTDIVDGKNKVAFAGFPKTEKIGLNDSIKDEADIKETFIESYADPVKYASKNEPDKHGFIMPVEVEHGFSGSPVFAVRDSKVFAVISALTMTDKAKAHYIGPFISCLRYFNT